MKTILETSQHGECLDLRLHRPRRGALILLIDRWQTVAGSHGLREAPRVYRAISIVTPMFFRDIFFLEGSIASLLCCLSIWWRRILRHGLSFAPLSTFSVSVISAAEEGFFPFFVETA